MAARVQCRQVPSRHPGSDLRSGAGPLSPAGCGLELLGALELLPRPGIDLSVAHVAASGAGAASGAAAGARVAAGVTGVARTGIAGVRAARVAGVGAAGVSRLFLLLGALENHLGFGFGEDLLVLLLL